MMKLIKGEESLFYIKKGQEWVPLACLTSNNFSESAETIETTTRQNGGWKTILPTMQSYTIAIEGFMVKDDVDSGNNLISYRELRQMKRDRVKIEWITKTLSGWYVDRGFGYITDISDSNSVESMIGFSATIQGFGQPISTTDKVYVLGNNLETELYAHGVDNNTLIQTN